MTFHEEVIKSPDSRPYGLCVYVCSYVVVVVVGIKLYFIFFVTSCSGRVFACVLVTSLPVDVPSWADLYHCKNFAVQSDCSI